MSNKDLSIEIEEDGDVRSVVIVFSKPADVEVIDVDEDEDFDEDFDDEDFDA